MILARYSKKDLPELPVAHYKYKHVRFPVGDNIPCKIHDVYIDMCKSNKNSEGDDDVDYCLFVVVRYGPYLRKEIIEGVELRHIIKQKYLIVEYSIDDSYKLVELFTHYNINHSQVEYPDFDPHTGEEKIKYLTYFQKIFQNNIQKKDKPVYVDTEVFEEWRAGSKRIVVELVSKLKMV